MKKLLASAFAALCLVLASCSDKSDEPIWDYAPYILSIDIVDSEGNNLLDPEVKGNIADQPIRMLYRDEAYEMLIPDETNPKSRYYLPRFFGLVLSRGRYYEIDPDKPWQLWWGELDRSESRTFNFELQIESINRAPFSFELKINNKGKGEVEQELYLDGKKVATPTHCTIVL